jgi:hypothetical protein
LFTIQSQTCLIHTYYKMNATQESEATEIWRKWSERRAQLPPRPLERTDVDYSIWEADVIADGRGESGGRAEYLQTLELIDLLECIVFDRLGSIRSGCCIDKSNHVIISRKENIHTELIRDIQRVVEIKHSVLTEQYRILENVLMPILERQPNLGRLGYNKGSFLVVISDDNGEHYLQHIAPLERCGAVMAWGDEEEGEDEFTELLLECRGKMQRIECASLVLFEINRETLQQINNGLLQQQLALLVDPWNGCKCDSLVPPLKSHVQKPFRGLQHIKFINPFAKCTNSLEAQVMLIKESASRVEQIKTIKRLHALQTLYIVPEREI